MAARTSREASKHGSSDSGDAAFRTPRARRNRRDAWRRCRRNRFLLSFLVPLGRGEREPDQHKGSAFLAVKGSIHRLRSSPKAATMLLRCLVAERFPCWLRLAHHRLPPGQLWVLGWGRSRLRPGRCFLTTGGFVMPRRQPWGPVIVAVGPRYHRPFSADTRRRGSIVGLTETKGCRLVDRHGYRWFRVISGIVIPAIDAGSSVSPDSLPIFSIPWLRHAGRSSACLPVPRSPPFDAARGQRGTPIRLLRLPFPRLNATPFYPSLRSMSISLLLYLSLNFASAAQSYRCLVPSPVPSASLCKT